MKFVVARRARHFMRQCAAGTQCLDHELRGILRLRAQAFFFSLLFAFTQILQRAFSHFSAETFIVSCKLDTIVEYIKTNSKKTKDRKLGSSEEAEERTVSKCGQGSIQLFPRKLLSLATCYSGPDMLLSMPLHTHE
jgi:hypothetical protein